MSVRSYIGLGGNQGDSMTLFLSAIRALGTLPQTCVVGVSPLYKTPPMGPADQAEYHNAVVMLETELQPLELLDGLQAIEQEHGRVRKDERWGPRTLDLDILLYGEQTLHEARLQVPHYGLAQRIFVVQPLVDLMGENALIPGQGRLGDLLERLEGSPIACLGVLSPDSDAMNGALDS